jgi:hypothetical protein
MFKIPKPLWLFMKIEGERYEVGADAGLEAETSPRLWIFKIPDFKPLPEGQ